VALSGLADLVGQTATVWGRVVSTASFSKGFKFTLDDGTGQVTLLLWHDVYDACADAPGLNVGAQVRAVGEVGTYDGELQLEPQSGDAVDVLTAGGGGGPLLEAAALGDALGQRVAIEGELVTVQDAGSGTKLFVSDGTGQALVFIWDTVLTRIPGANPALGTPGTRLRVTGQVKEYEGTLELVPVLPYDVEILQ
jgi:RecJ-like exonuclease